MALTSQDINTVSFSVDRKGYNVDEVDVFLEHVAEEVDAMNKLIEQLQEELASGTSKKDKSSSSDKDAVSKDGATTKEDSAKRIEELEKQIADFEEQLSEKESKDSAIAQALIVAQRSADDIVAQAHSEASTIVKDADEQADRIIEKAEAGRLKIAEAIRSLEKDRSDLRLQYSDMLSDFITDAQNKLTVINEESQRTAQEAQAQAGTTAANAPLGASKLDLSAAPQAAGEGESNGSATGYVDKDFSGYGDATDDFSFDID